MLSEKGFELGGCLSPFFIVDSDGVQETVDGSGRDGQEGLGEIGREVSKGLGITGEPEGEEGFQTF